MDSGARLGRIINRGDSIDYCDECAHCRVEYIIKYGEKRPVAYCEKTGKILHPYMFFRGQGNGPARHCRHR